MGWVRVNVHTQNKRDSSVNTELTSLHFLSLRTAGFLPLELTSLEPDSSRDQAIHRHPVHDQLFFEHRRGMCVQPTSAGSDQTTEEHKYTAILKEFL